MGLDSKKMKEIVQESEFMKFKLLESEEMYNKLESDTI